MLAPDAATEVADDELEAPEWVMDEGRAAEETEADAAEETEADGDEAEMRTRTRTTRIPQPTVISRPRKGL